MGTADAYEPWSSDGARASAANRVPSYATRSPDGVQARASFARIVHLSS
jgi:hypothetical protein